MQAVKENRVYTINDSDVESFRKEGYDIYDEVGNLVKHGAGKTVPYEKYEKVVEENEKLMAENAELTSQVKKLEKAKKTDKKTEA